MASCRAVCHTFHRRHPSPPPHCHASSNLKNHIPQPQGPSRGDHNQSILVTPNPPPPPPPPRTSCNSSMSKHTFFMRHECRNCFVHDREYSHSLLSVLSSSLSKKVSVNWNKWGKSQKWDFKLALLKSNNKSTVFKQGTQSNGKLLN